jgi:putative bacteriocin precursor
MKKLYKKLNPSSNTVEAYTKCSCNCYCSTCFCSGQCTGGSLEIGANINVDIQGSGPDESWYNSGTNYN